MKFLYLFLSLVLSVQALAEEKFGLPWHVECENEGCFMQVITPYQGPDKIEQAGLVVAYNTLKSKADYVGFYLPSDVDADAGLIIKFIDTVPDGDSFKLVPAEGSMARLPINNCNKNYCASLVHQEIQSSHESKMDLIQELLVREHVWLAFKRNGEDETLILPSYKFRDEFAKLPD